MVKGARGESCADAIRQVMQPGKIMTFTDLYNSVKKMGTWKDETIWQHLMALVVNLPPASRHWPNKAQFLFLRPDGRYELYQPGVHPQVIE